MTVLEGGAKSTRCSCDFHSEFYGDLEKLGVRKTICCSSYDNTARPPLILGNS